MTKTNRALFIMHIARVDDDTLASLYARDKLAGRRGYVKLIDSEVTFRKIMNNLAPREHSVGRALYSGE